MIYKCPGQDQKNITAEILKCSKCGYEKEIFSDEIKSKCPKCQSISSREVLPTCIDWCKYAKECVGGEAYDIYARNKTLLLKDKLTKELEGYFGRDIKRINHAQKVLDYAEKILAELKEGGVRAELKGGDETLGKRIRNTKLEKIPYILVVGDKEVEAGNVSVESRDRGQLGTESLSIFIEKIKEEINSRK